MKKFFFFEWDITTLFSKVLMNWRFSNEKSNLFQDIMCIFVVEVLFLNNTVRVVHTDYWYVPK